MIELHFKKGDERGWTDYMVRCTKITKVVADKFDKTVEIHFDNADYWCIGGRLGGYIMYKGKEYTGDYIYENYESFKKLLAVINHNSEIEDAVEKL